MFVIPVKFDPERPIIFECVDAIRLHHPDARILVVDSDSEDQSYLDALDVFQVAPIRNRHYSTGAFRWAFEQYPDEPHYEMLFDSLICHGRIDRWIEPFIAMRHFITPPTGWGWDADGVNLGLWAQAQVDFTLPDCFVGIMGPMFLAHREVIAALYDAGFFHIEVNDAFQNCAMERLAGIFLRRLGYDPAHSIQGEMRSGIRYDESLVEKRAMARA